VTVRKLLIVAVTALLVAACGAPAGQTVARVDSVTLTRQTLDEQIARIEKGFEAQVAQGLTPPSRIEIEQEIVSRFIDQNLTLSVARERGIAVTDQEVDDQIAEFNVQIPQATGGTLEDAVVNQLGLPGAASTEFRQFVTYILAQEKLSESLVSDTEVRQRVTEEVMAETERTVPVATVAHILVPTEEEANQVIERLDAGEDFAALAAELSQDPGSAQNGGVYEGVQQGQMVPPFDKATFEDLQPGETTATPVQTDFGYHVIRLISREEQPALAPEQAQEAIDMRVDQEIGMQRQEALAQLIRDERAKAEQEQRIVEPTYPTPTVDPALPTPAPMP
jgi:parvulin-like peptidyl-prolyl isomerase